MDFRKNDQIDFTWKGSAHFQPAVFGGKQNRKTIMTAYHSQEETKKYQLELLDQFLFFQEDNNDHQIRCVIHFGDLLDRTCIQKAILQSIRMIPILGCRFVENEKRSYWEKVPLNKMVDRIFTFVDSDNPEDEIVAFLSAKTDESAGPQIRIKIIRNTDKDTLCIVLNHMAFDGTGFKEYLYLLGRLYSECKSGQESSLRKEIGGDRSLGRIFKQFKFGERLRVLTLPPNSTEKRTGLHFPRTLKGDVQPLFLTYKLLQEQTNRIKQFGKENGFTVNDMIIAGYYRALYHFIQNPDGLSLGIPCMIDLRRYLPEGTDAIFCNLPSMVETRCEPDLTFTETVREINKQMNEHKDGYPGLYGFGILSLIQKILSYKRLKKFIRKRGYPLISISNLGVIDSKRLHFDGNEVKEAAIMTALKHFPYFQLTFSTYKDVITLSISLFGTKEDRESVQRFFEILVKQFP